MVRRIKFFVAEFRTFLWCYKWALCTASICKRQPLCITITIAGDLPCPKSCRRNHSVADATPCPVPEVLLMLHRDPHPPPRAMMLSRPPQPAAPYLLRRLPTLPRKSHSWDRLLRLLRTQRLSLRSSVRAWRRCSFEMLVDRPAFSDDRRSSMEARASDIVCQVPMFVRRCYVFCTIRHAAAPQVLVAVAPGVCCTQVG
jgi:hypothetical protein